MGVKPGTSGWAGAIGAAMLIGGCTTPMPPDMAPMAPPVPVSPVDAGNDYAALDQAEALLEALGDSAPDFSFQDGDVRAYAWEAQGGWMLIEEAGVATGTLYFYAPGETAPFLIRDQDHGLAFDLDHFVIAYASDGRILDTLEMNQWRNGAMQARLRGVSLYRAARQRLFAQDAARMWEMEAAAAVASRTSWIETSRRQRRWQLYRERPESMAVRHALSAEGERRRAERERRATVRPDRPGGAGRPDRPAGADRPERPEGAGRPDRPQGGDRPDRSEGQRPGRPQQPGGEPAARPDPAPRPVRPQGPPQAEPNLDQQDVQRETYRRQATDRAEQMRRQQETQAAEAARAEAQRQQQAAEAQRQAERAAAQQAAQAEAQRQQRAVEAQRQAERAAAQQAAQAEAQRQRERQAAEAEQRQSQQAPPAPEAPRRERDVGLREREPL